MRGIRGGYDFGQALGKVLKMEKEELFSKSNHMAIRIGTIAIVFEVLFASILSNCNYSLKVFGTFGVSNNNIITHRFIFTPINDWKGIIRCS